MTRHVIFLAGSLLMACTAPSRHRPEEPASAGTQASGRLDCRKEPELKTLPKNDAQKVSALVGALQVLPIKNHLQRQPSMKQYKELLEGLTLDVSADITWHPVATAQKGRVDFDALYAVVPESILLYAVTLAGWFGKSEGIDAYLKEGFVGYGMQLGRAARCGLRPLRAFDVDFLDVARATSHVPEGVPPTLVPAMRSAVNWVGDNFTSFVVLHELAHHALEHVKLRALDSSLVYKREVEADNWAFRHYYELNLPVVSLATTLAAMDLVEKMQKRAGFTVDGSHPSWEQRSNAFLEVVKKLVREKTAAAPFFVLRGYPLTVNPEWPEVYNEIAIACPNDAVVIGSRKCTLRGTDFKPLDGLEAITEQRVELHFRENRFLYTALITDDRRPQYVELSLTIKDLETGELQGPLLFMLMNHSAGSNVDMLTGPLERELGPRAHYQRMLSRVDVEPQVQVAALKRLLLQEKELEANLERFIAVRTTAEERSLEDKAVRERALSDIAKILGARATAAWHKEVEANRFADEDSP